MKTTRTLAMAAPAHRNAVWRLHVAQAQIRRDIKRTDLMRHDLSAPGREVIQVRVDFAPGRGRRQAQRIRAKSSSMSSKARSSISSRASRR